MTNHDGSRWVYEIKSLAFCPSNYGTRWKNKAKAWGAGASPADAKAATTATDRAAKASGIDERLGFRGKDGVAHALKGWSSEGMDKILWSVLAHLFVRNSLLCLILRGFAAEKVKQLLPTKSGPGHLLGEGLSGWLCEVVAPVAAMWFLYCSTSRTWLEWLAFLAFVAFEPCSRAEGSIRDQMSRPAAERGGGGKGAPVQLLKGVVACSTRGVAHGDMDQRGRDATGSRLGLVGARAKGAAGPGSLKGPQNEHTPITTPVCSSTDAVIG